MKLIGITGGIGSGKTTVANFFKELGIPVYIADDEAKKLMHRSPIKEELINLFGEEAYDQSESLNRKFIAAQVFDRKKQLEQLNQIVHPRVTEDFKSWIQQQHAPYVLYEAAILYETGRYKDFDFTILVTADKSERIARIKNRDQSTEKEIESRMKNQWSDKKKRKLADFVIENHNLNETRKKVYKLNEVLLKV